MPVATLPRPLTPANLHSPIYVFWDNSNVFISAKSVASQNEGRYGAPHIRIEFEHLFDLARAGRSVVTAICVGSVPPQLATVWDRLEKTGIRVEKYERGQFSGREQGVDQCLQLWMLRALADAPKPATAVLLTGDGKGYEDGVGFRADLERLHSRGWGIEVVAWEKSCARRLREWAGEVGVFVRLEDHYSAVTFLEEGRRRAKIVDLSLRKIADPTGWSPPEETEGAA
ncbi:MAG TPA: NYN domain-containing protein [Stellaceae bacterium]|nr:NYN domain-containing protein [Stellaceae bacterium]